MNTRCEPDDDVRAYEGIHCFRSTRDYATDDRKRTSAEDEIPTTELVRQATCEQESDRITQ